MTVYVGDLLTASAASVTGKPTPTRTWQWLRGSSAISGATSSTYTVAEADIGENLSVKQIETNIAGSAEATSLTVGPVASFTVAQLFASGEEGAWYEPSTTTAFASTTDLTPCGYGDSCGLLLDKSQGAGYSGGSFTGLGSELVDNGDFATGDLTAWTEYLPANGDVTVSGGEVTIAKTGSSTHGLYQDLTATAGTWHLLRFDVTALTATASFAVYGAGFTILELNGTNFLTTAKTYEYLFFASTATPRIYFVAGNGNSLTIDNISVRELPGNHATQSTASARPILARVPEGGRRNLLEKTEQFDNAYWSKGSLGVAVPSVSPDQTASPASTVSADQVTFPAVSTSGNYSIVFHNLGAVSAGTYTFSIYLKGSVGGEVVYLTLATGVPTTSTECVLTTSWQRFDISTTLASTSSNFYANFGVDLRDATQSAQSAQTVFAWGAQLETGSTATAYQKVVDQYDVTEAGVTSLDYLAFDGTDDYLVTASDHPFTFTGPVSVFSGFTKLGTTKQFETLFAVGATGNSVANGDKSMGFQVTDNGSNRLATDIWRPSGVRGSTTLTSPVTSVASFNIANWSTHRGGGTDIRLNGVGETEANYGTFNPSALNTSKMYVGVFDTILTTSFFNGNMYGLVVRNASSTANEISQTETYLANRSGVVL